MGRQINFYMSEKVQQQFRSFLRENDYIFLTRNGEKIIPEKIDEYWLIYVYRNEFGPLLFKENDGTIDILNSPIIEFNSTTIKEKSILRGRLWISVQFYEDHCDQAEESKKYIREYQKLYRWIRKNVPYQEIPKGDFYIKEYTSSELIEMTAEGYIFDM